jgi:hypothetical protein
MMPEHLRLSASLMSGAVCPVTVASGLRLSRAANKVPYVAVSGSFKNRQSADVENFALLHSEYSWS